jgi:hypothetical protein
MRRVAELCELRQTKLKRETGNSFRPAGLNTALCRFGLEDWHDLSRKQRHRAVRSFASGTGWPHLDTNMGDEPARATHDRQVMFDDILDSSGNRVEETNSLSALPRAPQLFWRDSRRFRGLVPSRLRRNA